MGQTDQEKLNLQLNASLQKHGAIGARLISMIQVNRNEYIIKLQTADDRRLEVVFTTKIHFEQKTQMEVKYTDANQEQSTGRKPG